MAFDDDDDDDFIGQQYLDGGSEDYSDEGSDEGPFIFDMTTTNGPAVPACAFGYMSLGNASDGGDDAEYDAEYANHTRVALEALLEQADAALFGEPLPHASSTGPHVRECEQWRQSLGCLRVRGHTCPGAPSVGSEPTLQDTAAQLVGGGACRADESDGDDEPSSGPVGTAEHCVLEAALGASSLDLSVVGVAIAPRAADEAALAAGVAEEVFAAHGLLIEPIATDASAAAASADAGLAEGGTETAAAAAAAAAAARSHGGRRRRSEVWCHRRLGLPPRTPALAITENVLHALCERIWHSLVPLLAPVTLAVARTLLGGAGRQVDAAPAVGGGSGLDVGAAASLRRMVAAAPEAAGVVAEGGAPGGGQQQQPLQPSSAGACRPHAAPPAQSEPRRAAALPTEGARVRRNTHGVQNHATPEPASASRLPAPRAKSAAAQVAAAAARGGAPAASVGQQQRQQQPKPIAGSKPSCIPSATHAGPPGGRSGPAVRRT